MCNVEVNFQRGDMNKRAVFRFFLTWCVVTAHFSLAGDGGAALPKKPPAFGLKRTEDEARLKKVFELFEAKQFDQALSELKPILDGQPDLVTMQELACEIWARKTPTAQETAAQCRKAGEMAGSGPISWLHLARAQFATDPTLVVGSLAKAKAALDAKEAQPFVWDQFAQLALDAKCPSWVETAAAKVESADADLAKDYRATAARLRRWSGLPAEAKSISAEQESTFLKEFQEAQKRINLDEFKAAAPLVVKFEQTYPNVSGALALRCAFEAATKKAAPAKKACEAAIGAQEDNLAARMTLSTLVKPTDAIAQLTRVVELDPTHDLAYRRLAELYSKQKDTKSLKELSERYQTQFKRALPPR